MKRTALATMVALGLAATAVAQAPAPAGNDRTNQVSFAEADKNKDGKVNTEEGNAINGFDFSRADTDNDRSLTRQEFDLLYQLARRPGIVFSRAALLQNVWSDDTYVTERTVDTVISRLRRKIERDPQDPELILTAWGVGYKFVDVE